MTNVDAAVRYAQLGYRVFPARPGTKKPCTTHGFLDASRDEGLIRAWWDQWPDALIATPDTCTVDIETKPDGPNGWATWAQLLALHGAIPTAPLVRTGCYQRRRGGHLHFAYREDVKAGNFAPGIELRGRGAYVLLPPSRHTTGVRYEGELPPVGELPPLPEWIAGLRLNAKKKTTRGPIQDGARHETWVAEAGRLRKTGVPVEQARHELRLFRDRNFQNPEEKTDDELDAILKAYEQDWDGPPLTRQITSQTLAATPLTQVSMRSIEWLEKPLWQRSAFQLLAGQKGAGKGTYLAGLASRLSRINMNVLFVSSEDSTEIDLKPRLVAAQANIGRCYVIQQHVRLPDDIEQLHAIAGDLAGVGLLVIDPVANHIGDRNANNDAEVRDAIAPLNKLADELDCLVIGVRHPGKDRSRGAVASILGSTAWVDTPRAVVMLAIDDEDPQIRHIQAVAGNRSQNGSAQAFKIEAVPVEGLAEPITVAVPLGESAKSVDDLLLARDRPESKTARARELILDILETDGEQESDTLDARVAKETGLAVQTVKNARVALKAEGLLKVFPDKDELGTILRWNVTRSQAPRA